MSDTRGAHHAYAGSIPNGHILIHTGDFAPCPPKPLLFHFTSWYRRIGSRLSRSSSTPTSLSEDLEHCHEPQAGTWQQQVDELDRFFAQQPHAFKIFIPGCWENWYSHSSKRRPSPAEIQSRLKSAIYLQDSGCQLFGLTIYGTPWTSADDLRAEDSSSVILRNWHAFLRLTRRSRGQKTRLECVPETSLDEKSPSPPLAPTRTEESSSTTPSGVSPASPTSGFILPSINAVAQAFAKIPSSVDILVTHMPPWRDELYSQVKQRIRPSVHLCGHDFATYGVVMKSETLFSNAALQLTSEIPPVPPIKQQSKIRPTKLRKRGDSTSLHQPGVSTVQEADNEENDDSFCDAHLFIRQPNGRPRPPRWQRRLPICLSRLFQRSNVRSTESSTSIQPNGLFGCAFLRARRSNYKNKSLNAAQVVVSETLSSKAALHHQINAGDDKCIYDPDMRAGIGAISMIESGAGGPTGNGSVWLGADGVLRPGANVGSSSYSGSLARISGANSVSTGGGTAFCSSVCRRNPIVIDYYVARPKKLQQSIVLPSYAQPLLCQKQNNIIAGGVSSPSATVPAYASVGNHIQ